MRFTAATAAVLVAGASATYAPFNSTSSATEGVDASSSLPVQTTEVAAASSSSPVIYTTEVVTAYTTYCPSPTSIVHGSVTYTVTEVCVTFALSLLTLSSDLTFTSGYDIDHQQLPMHCHQAGELCSSSLVSESLIQMMPKVSEGQDANLSQRQLELSFDSLWPWSSRP